MSNSDQVIEIILKQVENYIEIMPEQQELWRQDVKEFCKLALSGQDFEACCEGIFRSPKECKELGLDRLHPIYIMRKNGEVSDEIYRKALEEKDASMLKLIAERRMGWAEHKKLEHQNAQDDFAKQFSGLLDDEE